MSISVDKKPPFEKVLPIINKVAKEYDFLNIAEEKYLPLAKTIFTKCQTEYRDSMEIPFDKYFKNILKSTFNYLVKEKLTEEDFSVFNRYVEKKVEV